MISYAMLPSRRRTAATIALSAVLLALSACGGAAAPAAAPPSTASKPAPAASSPSSAAAQPSAAPSASAKPAASSPAAKPSGLLTVRIAQSVPTLSFAPLIVARDLNFFQKQGVDLQFTQLQSGATAIQALVGGSVDFVDSASTEVAAAAAKGAPVLAVQGTAKMTLEVCIGKQYADSKGVTPSSSLEQRMAAFKGATLGITGPGAVSDRALRWLLQKYGKLNPDKDTTIISTGSDGLVGAIEQNKIQGYLLSPPQCELSAKKGLALVLVKPSEIPEFANYVHEVLYTTKNWASAHKDQATRTATALSMGNNYTLQHPSDAIGIIQKAMNKVDPQIVESTMKEIILPQIPKDGKMTEAMWSATNTVLMESGLIDKPLDVKDGTIWTNAYIGDATVP